MPHHKKTHEDWQKCLCLICFKNSEGLRQLTNKQRSLIDEHVLSGLGAADIRLPTGLCTNCRLILRIFLKTLTVLTTVLSPHPSIKQEQTKIQIAIVQYVCCVQQAGKSLGASVRANVRLKMKRSQLPIQRVFSNYAPLASPLLERAKSMSVQKPISTGMSKK